MIYHNIKIVAVVFLICLVGCTNTHVVEKHYQSGKIQSRVTVIDAELDKDLLSPLRKHGPAIYFAEDGSITHSGEWKDGKPLNGDCFILAAGDAGSAGGLGKWKKYKNGVEIP